MSRHSIAIVIHEGVQALDVAGPLDVFAEANGFIDTGGYDIAVVGRDTSPICASNGMRMSAELSFANAAFAFGTVLVAGGPDLPSATEDPMLTAWLCGWGSKATRYGSVCTGAFAIGRAGLLDGRSATTHWQNAHLLAAQFPRARIELDRIYLRDGPLVTSAGVTAGIDLALALVAEDYGPTVALSCAKRLVVSAQRQGGQSQFSPFLLPASAPESPLALVQQYVMEHPGESFSVNRLAEIARCSARTIARTFADELAVTPHEFVESVRIDHARNLLEATDLALKAVAYDCGFGTAEQMRLVFTRRLGITAMQYRQAFRIRGGLLSVTH